MAWKYYNNKELAGLLEVSEEDFHREIKRRIKKDFESELDSIDIRNPDILLNEDYMIRLADPRDHVNYYDTGLDFLSYK
jgi:hypothetical protein